MNNSDIGFTSRVAAAHRARTVGGRASKWWLPCALALVVPGASCRKHDDRPQVFPVRGKVLFRGQPAAGARVAFQPAAPSAWDVARAGGRGGAGGGVGVGAYEQADGAPAGQYIVTVTWPGPNPGGEDPGDEQDVGPDQLGGRYADPRRSSLRVTVKEEPNELEPITLE